MPLERDKLADYFTTNTNLQIRHHYYKETVERAEAFAPHSDGVYPDKLIGQRRPNEAEEVQQYRKEIWKAKTKPTFGRIVSSLSKIRRSADWSINYESIEYNKIAQGEELENYAEVKFPYFGSLTNWAFSILLKKYLIDPNAICFVSILNPDVEETDFKKPYPFIFDSKDVIEFKDDDFVILNDPAGHIFGTTKKQSKGTAYWYVDTQVVERWVQVNAKGDHDLESGYPHGLNELPAFKLGAIIIDSDGLNFLHESRIESILPELDEALREYSDLQAGKVLHMYAERWEYVQNECPECRGLGRISNPAWTEGSTLDPFVKCRGENCHNGYVATGPYSKILVRPNTVMEGGGSLPTPPAGYVEKDVEIIKLMEESVSKHIFDALAAINFQFLDQSPLNQSGTAKEVDKDELNNTVHAIAEDIVRILDNIYRLTAIYRYSGLYGAEDIEKMLPKIPVPEKFDILSASYLGDELDKAKKANFNPAILNAMELDYAAKKFNSDARVREMLGLVLALDPLSNITEDEKMSRLSNQGITKVDYTISSNINSFVRKAIEEDEKFLDLDIQDQRLKLEEMAQLVIGSYAAAIIPEDGLDAEDESGSQDADIIGKIPLAVQQLSLAAARATESGDTQLAATIKNKINQLLGQVVDATEDAVQ